MKGGKVEIKEKAENEKKQEMRKIQDGKTEESN